MNTNSIFGYDWEDIKRAQQGGRLAKNQVPYSSPEQRKATIEGDIARFKIPVAASVVKSLGITLPHWLHIAR